MYQRYIANSIKEAVEDAPVILINGARQTGIHQFGPVIVQHVSGVEPLGKFSFIHI
jgi:hypothetical protein